MCPHLCTLGIVCETGGTTHAKQYLCLRPIANKHHEGKGIVCETGGTIHAKQYLCLRPIVNKYHEGMVRQDSVKRGNSV